MIADKAIDSICLLGMEKWIGLQRPGNSKEVFPSQTCQIDNQV